MPNRRHAKKRLPARRGRANTALAGRSGQGFSSDPVHRAYNPVAERPGMRANIQNTIRAVLSQSLPAQLTTSTIAPSFGGYAFTLSETPNASQYTGVFDQYRIDRIEVWLEPQAAQGTTVFGLLASAVDLDDYNTPTSIANVVDKQGSVMSNGGAGIYHTWQPHVALAAYAGTFSSYANTPSPWLDSNSPAVQHFGLKFACEATPVAVAYRLSFKLHCTFRATGF